MLVRMARKTTNGSGEAPKKPGPPSTYTPEMAARICEEMAQGKSLRSILEQPGMPDRMTVIRWLAANEDFRAQYTIAREIGLDHFAELTLAEAEADIPPEKVQAAKLKWDARRWHLSKMLPKRYGDRVMQEHVGADGRPVGIQAAIATISLHPREVVDYVRKLLTNEEAAMGLPPAGRMTEAERMKRITTSGQFLSPEMYEVLHDSEK
jgi:hypothetical protein